MIKKLGRLRLGLLAGVAFAAASVASSPAFANGTETLGDPSIDIAEGSGVVVAGTGLVDQPGFITLNVPGEVSQALLYWEGRRSGTRPGDDTLTVQGIPVLGEIIGGPTFFVGTSYSSVYRADITDLNLVSSGANSLIVEGFDVSKPHGAGLMVIYDDGTVADIAVKDGIDIAYINFTGARQNAIPQDLMVTASQHDRIARLNIFISSISGELSGGGFRPSAIDVTINGVTETFNNLLNSNNGEEWDTVSLDIVIPAGVDTVTVVPRSVDNLGVGGDPASASWVAASLSVTADNVCKPNGYTKYGYGKRKYNRHGYGKHGYRNHGYGKHGYGKHHDDCDRGHKKHRKDRCKHGYTRNRHHGHDRNCSYGYGHKNNHYGHKRSHNKYSGYRRWWW